MPFTIKIMQREEQVILIMQIVQKQRRKNPRASELEILANTKTVCGLLIDSEDLEKEVVEDALSIIFDTEKAMVEKKRAESAMEAAKKAAEIVAKKEKEFEELRKKLSTPSSSRGSVRTSYPSYDPCSGGYSSSRGGRC